MAHMSATVDLPLLELLAKDRAPTPRRWEWLEIKYLCMGGV